MTEATSEFKLVPTPAFTANTAVKTAVNSAPNGFRLH